MSTASIGLAGRPLWEKLIMTVVLTAGLGPLVCTIVALILAGIASDLSPGVVAAIARRESIQSIILLGYFSGGVQALLCGMVFAAYGWWSGALPIKAAIAAAPTLALLFKLVLFGMGGDGILFSTIIHIVPALVTWWLVKAYWQRTEA